MYVPIKEENFEAVTAKTTIKTFEQLNEPIVISMEVSEKEYLFGMKSENYKTKRLGSVIAVLDVETDTVYDWIFYPGAHGFASWRLTEAGTNPVRYLMSSPGTKGTAVLSPEKTTLTIVATGINENFWCDKTTGTKVPLSYYEICKESEEILFNYYTKMFDCETFSLSEANYNIQTNNISTIYLMRDDPDGNLWISYQKSNDLVMVQKFDLINEIPSDSYEFSLKQGFSYYHVDYVSNDYVFVSYNGYFEGKGTGLVAIDRHTGEKIKISNLESDIDMMYVNMVQKVGDSFYAIAPNSLGSGRPTGVNLYKLNMETKSAEKEFFLPFDMTENTYVRGNRIYFMCSRKINDITYTYYDTETKSQGDVVRVTFDDVINTVKE